MIVAFAGRRIDAEGAGEPGKFPLANVDRVDRDVDQFLRERQPAVVVGSAACGADLVVLEAAARLGIRRRVVLPFDRAAFRTASVTDRPGNWGPRFDAAVAALAPGDLIELQFDSDDETAYEQTNVEIFRQCGIVASLDESCVALILWNGETRGKGDVTEAFLDEADRRGWPTVQIQTNGS
jgi:hypothetical protein